MVNKTAVGLLGVIVVASLGVGILIGMQLGGGAVDAGTDASPSQDAVTETPASAEPNSTAATEAPPTETATPAESHAEQRTTVPARQFDESEIADHVATFINQERRNQDRSRLKVGDGTAESVALMAGNHSVAMADAGTVAHEIDGVSTAGRYKRNELFERCKFKSPEGSYISTPDEEFELIGQTVAGRHYRDDGAEQFNGDERAVARALVDAWNESAEYRERLLVPGPTRIGVGIEVTQGGKVYATADVCA